MEGDIPENQTPVTPRPAATIILLRDGTNGLEFLVLRKASGKHFAAGALVFPGGSVHGEDTAYIEDKGGDTGSESLEPLKVAAVREMYEEAAIILGRDRQTGKMLNHADVARMRAEGPADDFFALMAAHDFEPAIDQLERMAHWITPPSRPKRFDTHFFIAPVPGDQMEPVVDGYEIVAGAWRRPADLLARMEAGEFKMVLPTMLNVSKLQRWNSVDEAMAAVREEEVVCVQPVRKQTDEGEFLIIPEEAGYGVTVIDTANLRPA